MFIEFLNQNLWWFVALAVVANLLLFSFIRGGVPGVNFVSALELPAFQRTGKSVILDVNKADVFAQSHIPNSVNIPLEEISGDNKALIKHQKSTCIVVCQSGNRSQKAAKMMIDLGFKNVTVLRGGLLSWNKENLPTARA